MFNIFKRKPKKLPSQNQLEECERLGLKVKPHMSSRDVWQLVKDAKEKPEIKILDDKYIAEQNAILEKEDREEYGDAVVDELKKWEKVCDGNHYIVVYKKGKTLASNILEFESANIEGEKKFYVKIDALLPKTYKPRNDSHSIEWEKEISFRPEQILEIKEMLQQIDMFDIEGYEAALLHAKEIEAKYS